MNKYLQRFSASFIFALTLASPQLSYASYELFTFDDFPQEVREAVFLHVITDCIEEGKSFNAISRVNKQWAQDFCGFFKPWQPCWRAYLGVTRENEQVYRTFFNGALECRHKPADEKPAYTLPFLSLMNLSVKAFNLPADIEASQYVLITDKLQRFFEVGGDKDHILFATKAMIAIRMKSMNMSVELKAKLDEIMKQWDESIAPIGIFWRYSNIDVTRFAYLITRDVPSISSCNLFENWQKLGQASHGVEGGMYRWMVRAFHVCFEPRLEL